MLDEQRICHDKNCNSTDIKWWINPSGGFFQRNLKPFCEEHAAILKEARNRTQCCSNNCESKDIKTYEIPRGGHFVDLCDEHKPVYPPTIESVMRELLSATGKKISLELDPVFQDFYVYLHDIDCVNDCICEPFIQAIKNPLAALQQAQDRLAKGKSPTEG